ncbi:uncharacterized protein LOC126979654 isoform X2 [Leptidea sinapis]|uniref:uncharacterized protein LOC126979654 isoform X2 n=1 Tax=Leptidea sinapis TaxID=189913 RepID=UPI0021C49637|nr:uncharacterized protein LOC126979654 isoform X2 [Leptidea sinapis]
MSLTTICNSQDAKSHYFTQLIWATTLRVGCGRARFFVQATKPILVDRLVCNFSPRGNTHGKPIYTIGYPTTQCGFKSKSLYPGLCFDKPEVPEQSLLRILNLYNDTAKNIMQINASVGNESIRHDLTRLNLEHQKLNNANVMKRDNNVYWKTNHNNMSRNYNNFKQNKGHSRIYHSHDHKHEMDYLHPDHDPQINQDFRKYDSSKDATPYENLLRINKHRQCTRKPDAPCDNAICNPTKSLRQCTRSVTSVEQPCETNSNSNMCPHQFCSCTTTCSTNPSVQSNCPQEINKNNCPTSNFNCACQQSICNPFLRRSFESRTQNTNVYDDDPDSYLEFHKRNIDRQPSEALKVNLNSWKNDASKFTMRNFNGHSYRKRRDDELNSRFKPFWQIDDYNMRPEHQLKSIRYTTISNKRTQNRKYLKSTRVPTTEYITIRKNNVKHFTEKYLSFDELLRLRKVSADIYGARRAGENTTATTASADTKAQENTTEYTANTPFKRLKHCSRKLTCTWTAASLTNDPNKNRGSRTPPGYVEGCTRTSTCTRDDMNRNKMASTTDPSIEVESDSGGDDDDYCEKRALDIQRRNANIDIHDKTSLSLRDQEHSSSIIKPLDAINGNDKYACECDDSIRKKRELNEDDELVTKKCHKKRSKLSYGELFYLVVKKILSNWKNSDQNMSKRNCLCNSSVGGIVSNELVLTMSVTLNFVFISLKI